MDFLLEALTNWLKEMLVGGIMSNLSGMFDSVNQQVADISVQVGQTPQGWNGSIFSMIENLSNSIMVPIAGVILAIVMTVDLIQMIADKNNLHEEEFYTTPGYFGSVEHYHSPWERWYKSETPDGICTIYTDIKYNVPAGKYLLSIKGYTRKEQQKFPTPNCGFFFSFTEVDSFEGFKNPRESDEYDFNLGSIK